MGAAAATWTGAAHAVAPPGMWCRWIILPLALGGSAEPGNLRLLCAAHHRHRHADVGDWADRAAAGP